MAAQELATESARGDGRARPSAEDYQEISDFLDLLKVEDSDMYAMTVEHAADTEVIRRLLGDERLDIFESLQAEHVELTLKPLEEKLIREAMSKGILALRDEAYWKRVEGAVDAFIAAIVRDNRFKVLFTGDRTTAIQVLSIVGKYNRAALRHRIEASLGSEED